MLDESLNLGEWNTLIGQAWVSCLFLRSREGGVSVLGQMDRELGIPQEEN